MKGNPIMPSQPLRLLITGDRAESAAAALAAVVRKVDPDAAVSVQPADQADATLRRCLDPIALAGLILAIPGAVLTAMDIADRIRKRRRANALIDTGRQAEAELGVRVVVVTAAGARRLHDMGADDILALIEDPGR